MSNEQRSMDAARWRVPLLVGSAVVLAATIAAAVGIAMARDDKRAAAAAQFTPGPASKTATAVGSIRVPAGPKWQLGADCPRGSRFDDVHTGSQVTVTDASGKVLATAALGTGKVVDSATLPGLTTDCELPFSASVPLGVGPYGVEIGSHGVVRFDQGDLARMKLTLN